MSGLYALTKATISRGGLNLETADIRAIPVTALYTPNFTTHDFLDDVGAGARSATAVALSAKTLAVAAGVVAFDANDLTFPAVPTGDPIVALILYVHTGTESTSRLLAYLDYFTSLPITPDSRDIVFAFPSDAAKVFSW